MRLRQVKPGVYMNCRYCKEIGVGARAVWHLTGANLQSCNDHKYKLDSIRQESLKESRHYSEADYQTWLKL